MFFACWSETPEMTRLTRKLIAGSPPREGCREGWAVGCPEGLRVGCEVGLVGMLLG